MLPTKRAPARVVSSANCCRIHTVAPEYVPSLKLGLPCLAAPAIPYNPRSPPALVSHHAPSTGPVATMPVVKLAGAPPPSGAETDDPYAVMTRAATKPPRIHTTV